MANLYSIDVRIYATAYIKADSKRQAQKIAESLRDKALELDPQDIEEVPICGLQYDDPELPDVSLSPAMMIYGPDDGVVVDLVEENLSESEDA